MADKKVCPACGAPMTAGYALIKQPGAFATKRVPTAAWVCEAPGCRLGSHIGMELKTTTGLRRIDLKKRHQTLRGKRMGAKKEWPEGEVCKECGKTDSPRAGREICQRCYQRLWARAQKKRGVDSAVKQRALRPEKAAHVVPVAVPAAVHKPLTAIAQAAGITVDDFAAGILERFLTGIGVEVKR